MFALLIWGSFICPLPAYGCQRLQIEVAFLIRVFCSFRFLFCFSFCCFSFLWIWLIFVSIAFAFDKFCNATARERDTKCCLASNLSQAFGSDSLIVWFRFWPTRIKYIYLMHLQNIDDVHRCSSLSLRLPFVLYGGKPEHPEHLTWGLQSGPLPLYLCFCVCVWRIFYACMTYHHRFTLNFNNCELSVCSLFLSKMKMKCRH